VITAETVETVEMVVSVVTQKLIFHGVTVNSLMVVSEQVEVQNQLLMPELFQWLLHHPQFQTLLKDSSAMKNAVLVMKLHMILLRQPKE
jgi:hypothetical protein